MVQVKGEVRQDWLHSNVESADYNATTFTLGHAAAAVSGASGLATSSRAEEARP